MSTLIYAPQIQVHIRTARGLIDVSEDLVNWQLNLRENAPHTFSFSLQNAQRKYDGRVLPMDTISIKLKRLNWLQGFTGFVNQVPIFQAWPGTINMSATCTLKIPQFWYWDPTTARAQAMMLKALNNSTVDNTDATRSSDSRARDSVQGDRGIKGLIVDSMSQVMGWDQKRIHIGQIPNDWFKWSGEVAKLIGADEALYKAIGGGYTAAGSEGGSILASLPPGQYGAGQYGGVLIDQTQAKNASIIYSAVREAGVGSDRDYITIMVMMCALAESTLHNWASPAVPGSTGYPNDGVQGADHDSAGLFQQRLLYYGPVGKIMDPRTATKAFLSRLEKVLDKTRRLSTSMYGYTVQSVQRSAVQDGSNYQQFLGPATAIVKQLNSLNKAAATGAGNPTINQGSTTGNGTSIADPRKGFKAAGAQVAVVGLNLIKDHTPPRGQYIQYALGGDDPADTDSSQVTKLDCSSLVDWVYYHSTGLWLSGKKGQRNNVASIQTHCVQISLDAAKHIQGAVLTAGANEHTALSIGNGTCVAAKTNETPLPQQVVAGDPIDGQGFDKGWLLPGVDYSSSATTKTAMNELRSVGVNATKLGSQLTDVGDPSKTAVSGSPFLSLLDNLVLNPVSNQSLGQTLGGPVALINDQPFLPWLQSLVNGTMRSFCSAPNGDFIAWFPDYFGVWGMAGKLVVEEVELQDFTVYWSDQQMVTHQFVLGNQGLGIFDQATGGIGFGDVASDLMALALGTAGIASFDYPEIFKLIYGATAPRGYIDAFLRRFGARPDVQTMPFISRGQSEFFMALYLFIQRWAAQFTAQVPMTFMPEAFPGMLMQIPRYGFQAYIQGVTHTGSYGPGGGFTTTLDICAPSNIGGANRNDLLALLPIGSDVNDTGPDQKKAKKARR